MAAPEALSLNFRAPENKVWNKCPKPSYFLPHCIYLHKNHLQWELFSGSSSDSPRGTEFSICLCWLMFPLLSSMKMSSYNASHLTFLSPSHFKDGPIEVSHPHDLDSPWLNSHPCKNVLRLHTSAWWPDVYHQFTWQLELLLLGLHFTRLRFSLSFSDKPRFLPTLAFSVTMYFSDSLIEGKWSLAPFNSDIASGSQTDVCHCSFYFGGSGMHKAWEMAMCPSSA